MRTKRILSILLAMIMAVGAFGIFGVSAEDAETEAVVLAADKGWKGNVVLREDASLAGSMSEAVVVWDAFIDDDATPGVDESFNKLYTDRNATFQWRAWRVANGTSGPSDVEIIIRNSRGEAINTSGVYWAVNTPVTQVKLNIEQVSGRETYGWIYVQFTVNVPGSAYPSVMDEIWVELRDPSELAKKILEAEKELAKTDRYTKEYLNNLSAVTRYAKSLLGTKPTQAELDRCLSTLNNALKGLDADGKSVGKIYKLVGWEWFDKLFSDSFLKGWWSFVDVFKPIVDFFGQVGNALKSIMPFFTLLFGLLAP